MPKDHPRIRWISCDLSAAIDGELRTQLASAPRVLHFAWTRTGSPSQVGAANCAMIRNLLRPMPDAARFWFISSVSACPRPFSLYGKTKFECASVVQSLGGSTLVCGLVVEEYPATGPYRMLRSIIDKAPLALRAVGGGPLVFPLRMDDMGDVLVHVVSDELPAGIYRMFSAPVSLNQFISLLEQIRPRVRIPVPFSARLAIRGAAIGKRTRLLPERLCDQVMTFLYKDEAYLLAQQPVPGATLRACSDRDFFLGT